MNNRCGYALKLMAFMAAHRDRPSSVKKMCDKLDLPVKYCEQIMSVLKRAGYVEAEKGAVGGYRLQRSPDSYKAADVIALLSGEDRGTVNSEKNAAIASFFAELKSAEEKVMNKYTLADLISEE